MICVECKKRIPIGQLAYVFNALDLACVTCWNAHQGDQSETAASTDSRLDPVNHPPHYTFSSVEVIDALEAWQLGYHEACVVKYVVRAKHKDDELTDLKKAAWYLARRIAQLEGAR